MKLFLTIFFCLLPLINILPQEDYITVVGDSLVGKMIDGESVREVYGNVVLTQGDVVITCNKAVQFIARNNAELIGNVIVKQDNLTILTEHANYYGDQRKATSTSRVTLDDKKVILTADSGDYFFDEDKAHFVSNVKLVDTSAVLTSYELIYYKNENRMIAINDVKIVQEENIIIADSLEFFRNKRITYAAGNVSINNPENNVLIFGDHLEDYANEFYTLIDKNPLLIQIDTSIVREYDESGIYEEGYISGFRIDTLVIRSLVMEAWRDTLDIFKATDSVKIVRSGFASINDFTIYYRNEGKIITQKTDADSPQPVLWYETSQMTGDSVTIHIRENRIRQLEIDKNAFALSKSEEYPERYDQTSGERILLFFDEGELTRTEIYGNVLSIYYLYEEKEPNGLTKSSSQNAVIKFEDKEVIEVRLYGSPSSEFYPENQVIGKELTFTLPLFRFFDNKPLKEELLINN